MFSLKFKGLLVKNPDGIGPIEGVWILPIVIDILIIIPVTILCCVWYDKYEAEDEESRIEGPLYFATMWANLLFVLSTAVTQPTIVSCPSQDRHALRMFLFPNSNSSFQDLDQAVAAAAGATTLLTRLYSICCHHYKR